MSSANLVIFSHGFGVRKDDRGLFPDIAKHLDGIEPIMFDYNQFDEETNTLTAITLEEQVEKLRKIYAQAKSNHPNAVVDLICHSQGCVIAAMAQLEGIRKTVFLAPPDRKFGLGEIGAKIQTMLKRPGTTQDADGTLHYPRRDGSTTIIPFSYWQSRKGVDTISRYKELAGRTELVIVQATNDEVIGLTDLSELPGTVKIVQMDTGHDFENEARQEVAAIVAQQLEVSMPKSSVVVEKAQPQDAESIAEVQTLTWLATYPNTELGITEADIRKRLEGENGERTTRRIENWRKKAEATDGKSALYVARLNGKIVGFTLPAITPEGQHQIGALYVLPEVQGKGVGSQLIKESLAWHGDNRPIYLTVAAYNQNAINFYEKFGFQETGKQVEDLPARKSGNKELPEIEMMRPALEKS
jgi:ribosomal protein S18 acetylase RimI-like enzyme